ncbi:MAG: hypothetical protein IJQ12_07765 [Lachnospiraceae bacterium]|nr:hypothetical protein [Lachnospiraceae bacterium]
MKDERITERTENETFTPTFEQRIFKWLFTIGGALLLFYEIAKLATGRAVLFKDGWPVIGEWAMLYLDVYVLMCGLLYYRLARKRKD